MRPNSVFDPPINGKRVLMIAPTPYFSDRGSHVQIYEVARSQQLIGNDVRIVTYHLGRDMPGIKTYRTPPVPWYRKKSAGPSIHKLYLDLLLLAQTYRVAQRYKPHVLHAHMHEGAALALPVGRRLGIPVILDIQGSLAGELVNHQFIPNRSPLFSLFQGIEHVTNRSVDAVLMWMYLRDALYSLSLFDETKLFPVDYGVDLELFRPYPRKTLDDLAGQLQLPAGRKLVVYLGLLSEYQGVDLLLQAIPHVLQRCPAAHFLIMGYPREEYYRRKAQELGIAGHVTFPGCIDYTQAARYLSLGDVAVSAKITRMEGNGKLLNYLACGLPTVAFDLPGNQATLRDVGVYVPLGDYKALGAAIGGLLVDDARRRDLARRARRLAEQQYSWATIGRSIDAVYDTVLNRRRVPVELLSA